jgi:hypothetical protein
MRSDVLGSLEGHESGLGAETIAIDPYAAIRTALAPELANLSANEITPTLGRMPAAILLHQLLGSPQMRQAAAASLLGNTGRQSVLLDGVEVSIPVYLRLVSRLCREVAEQSEAGRAGLELSWETRPLQEQQVAQGSGATLRNAVGPKRPSDKKVNNDDDIKLVRHLINLLLPVPPAPLDENDTDLASTISAIKTFQTLIVDDPRPDRVPGVKLPPPPDGRVDPGGETIRFLTGTPFSFYPHWCRQLNGAVGNVNSSTMNPGFLTPTGVTRDSDLQKIVDRRVPSKFRKLLRYTLVDLTGAAKLANPQFAGNRETEQGGLGSMSKLSCMYGAHQLKFDLEELSRQQHLTDLDKVFAAARALWKDAQRPDPANATVLFPSNPKIELLGKRIAVDGLPLVAPRPLAEPDLERMFTKTGESGGGVTLAFAGSDHIRIDPATPGSPAPMSNAVKQYIRGGGGALGEARQKSFAERMFLMIDESDNAATHACLEMVSFLYAPSALWQAGIYSPQRGGGLWEASTHDDNGVHWKRPPVPRDNPKADFVSATAASIAALLTLMEQGRLVSSEASNAMKYLIDKRKPGVASPLGQNSSNTRSYFLEGLNGKFHLDRIHSKLGIGDFQNDCAIVVRTVKPDPKDATKDKQICYVAAGFDDPNDDGANLHELIVALDKCIRENNALLAPTAP